MGTDQIADMDVIANASTVRRRIIGSIDVELGAQPERRLDGDLDQVGCVLTRLPSAALGIGPGNIEIAQDDIPRSCAVPASRSMISVISLELP